MCLEPDPQARRQAVHSYQRLGALLRGEAPRTLPAEKLDEITWLILGFFQGS